MSKNRRIFDDVSKLATAAAGLVQGAGREAEMLLRHRLERLLDRMDLVTREEFDVVKAMAAKARLENEALDKRIEALEKVIQGGNAKIATRAAPTSQGKATAKSAAKAKKSPENRKK